MPKTDYRPKNSARQMERFERKHAELAKRVANLDDRVFLTHDEQAQMKQLKIQKLRMKDNLKQVKSAQID
jgi:uncharacterized protein YdcH (DUF465 family)